MTNPKSELFFKGPFHFDQRCELLEYSKSNRHLSEFKIDNPGIYIWGFVIKWNEISEKFEIVDYTSEGIQPISIGRSKFKHINGIQLKDGYHFIPYYVGKHEKSIIERIKKHREVGKEHARKYKRLSREFYCEFFNFNDFPINIGNSKTHSNELLAFNKKLQLERSSTEKFITYHNFHSFLNATYNLDVIKKEINDYPITDYVYILDTFKEIVFNKNNFWFCYATVDDKKDAEEILEAQVFYSLKGITVSETKVYGDAKKKFKHDIYFSEVCSKIFTHDPKVGNLAVHHDREGFKGYLK